MTNINTLPKVSIVIINYNGVRFVNQCINSVLATDYPNFKVIFIDNASTDGGYDFAKEKFGSDTRIRFIKRTHNDGPVIGRNIGIIQADGKYVVFLDNDTVVDKNWLKEAIGTMENQLSIGAAQCKLLLGNDKSKIDSCGHFLTFFGFPYEIGVGEKDKGQYDNVKKIFGAKSAAMIIRRDVLEKISGFDQDYFIYGEETDMCWRVWLAGYQVILVPHSIVYHHLGGTLNKQTKCRILYEGAKNSTKNLLKNMGIRRLFIMFPLYLGAWLLIIGGLGVKKRFYDIILIFKGLLWNFININHVLRDRKQIQEYIRRVSDNQIMPFIVRKLEINYILKKASKWLRKI